MKVKPTNSGTMVQARAQVLIGSLIPALVSRSTLANNFGVTKGPFFSDRPMTRLFLGWVRFQAVRGGNSAEYLICRLLNLQLTITTRTTTANQRGVRRLASLAGTATLGR